MQHSEYSRMSSVSPVQDNIPIPLRMTQTLAVISSLATYDGYIFNFALRMTQSLAVILRCAQDLWRSQSDCERFVILSAAKDLWCSQGDCERFVILSAAKD